MIDGALECITWPPSPESDQPTSRPCRAGAVMGPLPPSVDVGADLATARDVIACSGAPLLVVTTGGRVAGVITARDVHVASALGGPEAFSAKLDALCPAPVYVADVHEPLDHVLLEMAERQLFWAVVADGRGTLVGVLTSPSVCQWLAVTLRGRTPVRLQLAFRAEDAAR